MFYDNNRIKVCNSCIIIDNYVLGECKQLESVFQVWDPICHRYNQLGMYYDKNTKRLYLPRGIDIYKITGYLNEKYHTLIEPNPYKTIDNILMKYAPRDEDQKTALRFMCGVGEYEENQYHSQLSLSLSTGKGKTFCSIATASFLKIKSIVITHSNTLLNQWKDNIKEYTNLTEEDVLFISGSSMLHMILNCKSVKADNAKIFLCTHSTIRSFADTYGWDKLNDVFINLGIGIKFIDEAHKNFNNMLMIDFFTNVYKTYYVTATPQRSDWKEDRIYQLSIKNVPGIDLFDEDSDPHTSYVAIKWNSRPNAIQLTECHGSYGLDRNKYVDYVIKQPNFYKIMTIVMDMVIKCNGRVLMYIGTNEGIIKLYKWISENYPEFLCNVGIYTSAVSKEDKINKERNKKLLLSTTKSAGEGEDLKGLKMTILVAEPFKSHVLARQTLGRTRDRGTMYIELVDMGFKQIKKFYYSKLEIFNKYATDTSDIIIDQYELDRRYDIIMKERSKRPICPFILHDERFFTYPPEPPIQQTRQVIRPFRIVDNVNLTKGDDISG